MTMFSLRSAASPLMRMVPASSRLTQADLHTSAAKLGSWEIPERLKGIPTADNPGFFEMVEYLKV